MRTPFIKHNNTAYTLRYYALLFRRDVKLVEVSATVEKMPHVSEVRKALLDEFAYATESYPVDMRPENRYGPYKILYLGSSACDLKANEQDRDSTRVDLRKDWDDSLPKPLRERMEELDRKLADVSRRACFGVGKLHETGISSGTMKYQLKDLAIVNGEAELIPPRCFRDIQKTFHRNCLALVSGEEGLDMGSGSRRLYAVVRGSYYATISAFINSNEEKKVKSQFPEAELLPESMEVGFSLSREQSLMQIGKQSVIGIKMACFRMEKQSENGREEKWAVSHSIPICGSGIMPRRLKDQMVWVSSFLGRKFLMCWCPDRYSFAMVDTEAVSESSELDISTRTRFWRALSTLENDTDSTRMMTNGSDDVPSAQPHSFDDTKRTVVIGDGKAVDGKDGGRFPKFIARMRGGGPEEESIDDDGFVMGFDLRTLKNTIMGISLLPLSLEALDHPDFDNVIEWNTVTKCVEEDGSESVEVAPWELPIDEVVEAKRQILQSCIESLERSDSNMSLPSQKHDVKSVDEKSATNKTEATVAKSPQGRRPFPDRSSYAGPCAAEEAIRMNTQPDLEYLVTGSVRSGSSTSSGTKSDLPAVPSKPQVPDTATTEAKEEAPLSNEEGDESISDAQADSIRSQVGSLDLYQPMKEGSHKSMATATTVASSRVTTMESVVGVSTDANEDTPVSDIIARHQAQNQVDEVDAAGSIDEED